MFGAGPAGFAVFIEVLARLLLIRYPGYFTAENAENAELVYIKEVMTGTGVCHQPRRGDGTAGETASRRDGNILVLVISAIFYISLPTCRDSAVSATSAVRNAGYSSSSPGFHCPSSSSVSCWRHC